VAFQNLVHRSLVIAWLAIVVVWLVAAPFASRVVKRQSWGSRLLTMLVGFVSFGLLFIAPWRRGALALPVIPHSRPMAIIGVALTYAGFAIAIWARLILGRHWSASVTLKEDHQLIRRGPYRAVRHPIYSGVMLATLGTALVVGDVAALLGTLLSYGMWYVKSRQEERFMVERFGADYEAYRGETRALVPFIL
jgi:protein-S-isoprenylcysteine O-methyltransferase Ste14